jgi:O-methyltransferase
MNADDLAKLKMKLREAVATRPPGARVAIVGWTSAAFELASDPVFSTGAAVLSGIFVAEVSVEQALIKRLDAIAAEKPDIVVIADDAEKEPLLEAVAALLPAETKLLIGGFSHFAFRDGIFDRVRQELFIPSFANGYQNSLVHIYQCLQNARRQGLKGVVAEFGMFKGGTTMLISRFIEEMGADWKVFGFDTFDGFPPKRNALDMYAHPDCVFLDADLVKAVFAGRNVEVIEGDIVQTVSQLQNQDLVLSFVDTDNFSSANAIIRVIADRTVVGGAVVFDHWTGHDRHLDTIGERIAAKRLAADERYFNLHGTGVFLRQR